MEVKKCIKCNIDKLEEEFIKHKNRKGTSYFTNTCRECHKQYCKNYNRKDPNYLINYRKKKKDFRREQKYKAVEYLGGKCKDCNNTFHIAAYDFHHLESSEKEKDVGLLLQKEWRILKIELDKCILLCANCHRIRHYEEGTLGRISRP